ncbi:MAG: SH3 domain-containing protein [Phototrophicaceae bacterium]
MTPNRPTGEKPANSQPDHDQLLAITQRLANAPRPQMPPDMAERIRLRVQQAHAQQLQSGQTPERAGPGGAPKLIMLPVLRWVAAVALLVLVGMAAVVPASANSLPGDPLYAVKQGLEKIELALASEARLPDVHLRQANRRLDEAHKLIERQRTGADLQQALGDALTSLERVRDTESGLSAGEVRSLRSQTQQIAGEIGQVMATVDNLEAPAALLEQLDHIIEAGPPVVVDTPTPTASLTHTATATTTHTATATATVTLTATTTHTATATTTHTATVSPMPEPETFIAYVVAEGVANVRSGPGVSHRVIAQVARGATVTVIDVPDDSDWWNVRLDDGQTGWIYAELLSLSPPAPRPGQPAEPGPPSEPGRPGQPGPPSEPGQPGQPDDPCDLPGAACDAPGHGDNPPPGQGGVPPGQLRTPGPPGRSN